ncbi:MAG: CsbD family protein [Gemmatimonadaceae bacterium]
MNTDRIEGSWRQLRGKIKQQWGKLTADELDRVEGKWEELTGLVQRHYGKMRDEAERDIKQFREANDVRDDLSYDGRVYK